MRVEPGRPVSFTPVPELSVVPAPRQVSEILGTASIVRAPNALRELPDDRRARLAVGALIGAAATLAGFALLRAWVGRAAKRRASCRAAAAKRGQREAWRAVGHEVARRAVLGAGTVLAARLTEDVLVPMIERRLVAASRRRLPAR